MEESALKINATKYSGLPLRSLEFLVKTSAPIDKFKKREVWKELFYRYFTQGRHFNLYRILRGEPIPFSNTIDWELSTDDAEIPTEHVEDFIKDLLDFIEYVDTNVLARNNLQFEWELHELAGIKSMVERVRDAKIKDMNTRQKVNLFIDKINNARKKALIQIEEAKHQSTTTSKEVNELTHEKQIVISEERTALMKQELKHLDIAISKVTKKQWLEMIEDFRLYYPEDQRKIVRHGIKKYTYDIARHKPVETFMENLNIRRPEINMVYLLLNGIRKSGLDPWLQYLSLSTLDGFLQYIKDWYFEAKNACEESFDELRRELLYMISKVAYHPLKDEKDDPLIYESRQLYHEYLLNDLESHFWIVEKHEGGKLSDMLDAPSDYTFRAEYSEGRVASIKYNRSGTAEVEQPETKSKQISTLELYYRILSVFNGTLAHNEESYLRTGKKLSISPDVPSKYREKVRRFFQLPITLDIDPGCKINPQHPPTNQDAIESVIIYKFITRAIKTSELQWLYTTKDGYAFLESNTTVFRSSGMFHSHQDYVAEFLEEVIPLFDFKDEMQLRQFFKLRFTSQDIYGPYPRINKEVAEQIIGKLQDEIPHELQLVSDFFGEIDHEYTEFEVFSEFEGLTTMELFLLQQQGIEVGTNRQFKGYKERLPNGTVVHFTPDDARIRFIIDYYKNYFDAYI